MTRFEENEMIINEMTRGAKSKPSRTYEEMVAFQLSVIATMLSDISKSLAILTDKTESSDSKRKEIRTTYGNEELSNEGWILVSERPPEEGKTVIASTEYGVYPETRFTKEYGWEWAYEAGADYWRPLETVVAWMPLPERYKPTESEGLNNDKNI